MEYKKTENTIEDGDINKKTKRMLYFHFTKNILFYITSVICLYIIGNKKLSLLNFLNCIFTWICISFFGYIIHIISHKIDIKVLFNKMNNIFTKNVNIHRFFENVIDVYEYHDKIHHDSEVNKKFHNICYEFLLNVFTQGAGLILFIEFLKLLNYKVIFLWAFFYASVHNINYNIIHPTTHRDHHIDNNTNYGIDLMDILFNTKYNDDDIECMNHTSINMIIITLIIMYL
jgi:hypothetical protein